MKTIRILILAAALLAVPSVATAVQCGTYKDCQSYTLPTVRTELTTDYSYDAAKLRAGNGGVIFDPYNDPVWGGLGSWVLVDLTFKSFDGSSDPVHFVMCQDLNDDSRCDPYREPFSRQVDSSLDYWEVQNGRAPYGCTYPLEPIIVLILGADAQSQKVSPLAVGGSVQAYYGGC